MTATAVTKEQLEQDIRQLESDIQLAEVAVGEASLSADGELVSKAQSRLRDFRDHLAAARLGLAAADREEAVAAEAARLRGFDVRRLALYEYYAAMLPARARLMRHHQAYLASQKELQALYSSSHPETHQNVLVRAQQPWEHPGGIRGEGTDDPDECEREGEHFAALAEALRLKLEEGEDHAKQQ